MHFISYFSNLNFIKCSFSIFKSFLIISILFLFFSCTATKRIFNNNISNKDYSSIRVLLNEVDESYEIFVDVKVILSDNSGILAEVNKGNKINLFLSKGLVIASIQNQTFESSSFVLSSDDEIVKINGKKYRGTISIFENNTQLKIVNILTLEVYVKGVMTKEMPIGNDKENYEALKAFSICARTYALNKLQEGKVYFDIYPDTRDQVYGGVDGETEYTNSIVDETFGEVLIYDNKPATIFYHSTCGGYTEDVENVFRNKALPYLVSVEDGNDHYCKISPRYEWTEIYQPQVFVERLFKANFITSIDYTLQNLEVLSRFESGRVNELKITLLNSEENEKVISLFGNSMRGIIRTADNKSILRSNFFDIKLDEYKNITIEGRGSGHGVGLCQWGAIGRSKFGINYLDILNHYFPGTTLKNIYD